MAVGGAAVAHQIGRAARQLHRHRAGGRAMQIDAARDPGLAVAVDPHPALLDRRAHDVAEFRAAHRLDSAAVQRGIFPVAHDEPVAAVEKGEGVGRQRDGVLQPAEGLPREGHVRPQRDPAAGRCAARLDLDDAAVGELEIERLVVAAGELEPPPRHERLDAMRQHRRRDLAGRRLQPHDLAIGHAGQRVARRQAAEHIVEMLVGVGQPLGRIVDRDRGAQAVERRHQAGRDRRVRRLVFRRAHLLCRRKPHARFLLRRADCWRKGLRFGCAIPESARIAPPSLISGE